MVGKERGWVAVRILCTMTETVHLRARYRYASLDARDAALVAALGALEGSELRCQITLGAIVTVDVDVPLFGDRDFLVFELLGRGSLAADLVRQPEVAHVQPV